MDGGFGNIFSLKGKGLRTLWILYILKKWVNSEANRVVTCAQTVHRCGIFILCFDSKRLGANIKHGKQ